MSAVPYGNTTSKIISKIIMGHPFDDAFSSINRLSSKVKRRK